jgi:hypothetical protein
MERHEKMLKDLFVYILAINIILQYYQTLLIQ